jgi:hypothetical protein
MSSRFSGKGWRQATAPVSGAYFGASTIII